MFGKIIESSKHLNGDISTQHGESLLVMSLNSQYSVLNSPWTSWTLNRIATYVHLKHTLSLSNWPPRGFNWYSNLLVMIPARKRNFSIFRTMPTGADAIKKIYS